MLLLCVYLEEADPEYDSNNIDTNGGLLEKKSNGQPMSNNGRLTFEQFDICQVLERGGKLLGSAGEEFDHEQDQEFT